MPRHLALCTIVFGSLGLVSTAFADNIGVGITDTGTSSLSTTAAADDNIGVGVSGDNIGVGLSGDNIGVGSDAEWYAVIAEWFGTDDR